VKEMYFIRHPVYNKTKSSSANRACRNIHKLIFFSQSATKAHQISFQTT